MELEVYWLELAEHKLKNIYDYYASKSSTIAAEKLVDGILNTTLIIEKQAEIGQIENSLRTRKQKFRYLVYKNYKIIYWVNYDFKRIEIVNVFDTRQDPSNIIEIK
ncbi:MAG: type II toxin-antitoxin system RelE/ParE family toxin [Flavobacterium sp.]